MEIIVNKISKNSGKLMRSLVLHSLQESKINQLLTSVKLVCNSKYPHLIDFHYNKEYLCQTINSKIKEEWNEI